MICDKENEGFKIINGNSLEVLDTLKENSIDAIITDPPYELGFMGKKWDASGIAYNVTLWEKALRVLKPGGYLLAFGGTRTYHRIACAIEDAGFEIKDCIMWLYGSGFPKSQNVGIMVDKFLGQESIDTGIASPNARPNCTTDNTLYESGTVGKEFTIKKANNEWDGYGTCLKPAYEPIILAKKPTELTIAENVIEYRVGALNIDGCRVGTEERTYKGAGGSDITVAKGAIGSGKGKDLEFTVNGRFPANVIHDGSDEVVKDMPNTVGSSGEGFSKDDYSKNTDGATNFQRGDFVPYNDEGSASRYFYCAKASSKDRDEGLDAFESKQMYSEESGNQFGYGNANGDTFGDRIANVVRKNIHPTVKPTELMQYLVRLVCPKGATILDIFNGSGSTGKAVAFENRERNANYKYIGIELDPEYCEISKARIDYALHKYEYDSQVQLEVIENDKPVIKTIKEENLW